MAERTPEWLIALIVELFRRKLKGVEVQSALFGCRSYRCSRCDWSAHHVDEIRRCPTCGESVHFEAAPQRKSLATITRYAPKPLQVGRTRGTRYPGVGGRPAGTTTSPKRPRAFQLFAAGKNPSDVARTLGISRTRAGIFHKEYLASLSPTDDEHRN